MRSFPKLVVRQFLGQQGECKEGVQKLLTRIPSFFNYVHNEFTVVVLCKLEFIADIITTVTSEDEYILRFADCNLSAFSRRTSHLSSQQPSGMIVSSSLFDLTVSWEDHVGSFSGVASAEEAKVPYHISPRLICIMCVNLRHGLILWGIHRTLIGFWLLRRR